MLFLTQGMAASKLSITFLGNRKKRGDFRSLPAFTERHRDRGAGLSTWLKSRRQ
jgi:hypothetical protein